MKFVNKKLFLFLIFSLFFVTGFLLFNNLAQAQTSSLDLGLSQAAGTGLANTDIRTIIARIIRAALGLLGIVAVCLVLYAGYLWMTSGGDDEKIGSAKKILVNAVIGLVIILSAYSIVSFVMNKLLEATTGSNLALCEQQKLNGGAIYGGACPAQPVSTCPYGSCDGQFKIVQVPATGNVCIQNVAPVMVFNLDVDIDSLNSKAIVIDSSSVKVVGEWSLQKDHHHIAYFKPTKSACPAPDAGKDCFAATSTYKIKIDNTGTGIQSAGGKQLNCALSNGNCKDILFTTGDGVDRKNPVINIIFPTITSLSLKQGDDVEVKVNFSDDGGLQNLVLNSDDYLVTSSNFIGCQKSGIATITWPTAKLNIGDHTLKAIGLDWAANVGEGDSKANLKPAHCFNKELNLDLGETFIDCGGVCGFCSGNICAKNTDCVSGYCQKKNASDPEGVCVDKMRIISFSPVEAAKGDYVSVVGKYFGTNQGKVYFAKVDHPNPTVGAAHWAEAEVVNCGPGFKNWSDNQIIVSVPADAINAVSGTIKVVTAGSIFTDTSGNYDGWGDALPDFKLTNISHPSICGLDPNNGPVGKTILVGGKNFGDYDAAKSFVTFNEKTKAKIPNGNWTGGMIESIVPTSLGNGDYGVKVTNSNNVSGNSVLFTVSGSNPDAPFISSISAPANTAIGDYLTITGKNFGNVGTVLFKLNGKDLAPNGSFDFPADCKNSVWKDNQIVVKVPKGLNTNSAKYTIQIYNSVSELSSILEDDKSVVIKPGEPSPGICKISPVSGVVPFAVGKEVVVSGEYLGQVSKFYFWKIGGASNNIINTLIGTNVTANISGLSLTTTPNNASIVSGLVYAYRESDQKQSNGLLFSANDCSQAGVGCASSNDKCCLSGNEIGVCKPKGDLCLGEFKSSGFVWMFSTKEIVEPPQVVERCGAETESASIKKLPSPSPSTKWNSDGFSDASKVCQTALATVEFSSNIDQKSVTKETVVVNSCDSIGANGLCQNAKLVTLTDASVVLKVASVDGAQNVHPYLSLKSNTGKWDKNTLYQVVLKDGITSLPNINNESLKLMATNPCGVGTAYCFSFKTGEGDCVLKEVVVTPNDFWAKYLESPMLYHTLGSGNYDVFYNGNGLSNQHCTMMDVSGYSWKWGVKQLDTNNNLIVGKDYATIHGTGSTISTQVNTIANTVGVGLSNNSVSIVATASTSSISKTGSSPLTIDLSNPNVVEFWPNCLEACTNAAVGVRFNITMSNHNVVDPSAAIKLVQCNDENCFSTSNLVDANSNPVVLGSFFDAGSGNTILKIVNDAGGEVLKPSMLYQVTLSAVSPAGIDIGNQLWSAADLSNLGAFSKPYNKVFTWRFRTKKEACKVDHIDILPKIFTASKLKDLAVFQAQPYAAPDACNVTGQKLNPWTQNWNWTSSDEAIATVSMFKTKGTGAFCTSNCILKGSTVPSGQASSAFPICGNDIVEAGEDCDSPNLATGCGLTCRFLGNANATTTIGTENLGLCGDGFVSINKGEACDPNDVKSKVGCSSLCLHTGSKLQTAATDVTASICNNGMIGSGEDCDLGIAPDQKVPTSSMYCSAQCLHQGTRLSSAWCFAHGSNANPAFGGFQQKDYNFFCNQSYSQCGDGIVSPDEDVGCEGTVGAATGKHNNWCNDFCLRIQKNPADGNCTVNKEGCNDSYQNIGSSLTYSVPSICGDGTAGIGEDAICESDAYLTNLWHKDSAGKLLFDPWVLVIGKNNLVGKMVAGPTPVQESNITGKIVDKNVSGVGKYQVKCGYKTDEECQAAYSGEPNAQNLGVGNDSCCYFKTKLIGVYPGNTSTDPGKIETDVCINTFIEADFDSVIDAATLPGNFVIARSMSSACTGGLEDVSVFTSLAALNDPSLPWYKNIWNKIVVVIKNIFGHEVVANTWCAGADIGGVQVVKDDVGGSKVLFSLNNPLASLTDYVVILKKGIKNIQGVSIESKPVAGICAYNENIKCSVDSECDNKLVNIGNKVINKTKPGICNINGFGYYFGAINPDGTSDAYAPGGQALLCNKADDCIKSYGYVEASQLNGVADATHPVNEIYGIDPECKSLDSFVPNTTCLNNTAKAIGWRFQTGKEICAISSVTVSPDQYYFSSPNVTTSLVAKGLTEFNKLIQPVAGYFWNYQWGPKNSPYVMIASTTGAINTITSQNNNGEVDVRASANITDNKYTKQTGLIGTGKSHIIVFLCENPWPPKQVDISGAPTIIFPYEDKVGNNDHFDLVSSTFDGKTILASNVGKGYFNFSTYYCADNGNLGAADDLPYLRPAVQSDANLIGTGAATNTFKRFIFTSDKNSDAIGVQVLANPKHLSLSAWLADQSFGNSFQKIAPIDGYEAVSDGNNIYVSALNFDSSALAGNLYSNIYLFSINGNAIPETRKVFENLVKNLKFNINLTNYGYCGVNMANPDNTTQCVSDFDCQSAGSCLAIVETPSVCINSQNLPCTAATAATDCPPSQSQGDCNADGVCSNNPGINCVESGDCTINIPTTCIVLDIKSNKCSNNLTKSCSLDADCQIPQVCSVQKDKLKRNYQRIQDMAKVEDVLFNYSLNNKNTFPELKEGTYLTGQTVSTWPSWSVLSLPSDPINKLGMAGTCSSSTGKFCTNDATCNIPAGFTPQTCVLHDPVTGWSTADKRFSFACEVNSLAYRYFATSTILNSSGFLVKLRMEDPGLTLENLGASGFGLIDHPANFNILNNSLYGICDKKEEITTINQGTCGDGKLNINKFEECDPPGSVVWNQASCAGGKAATSIMTGQICTNNCKWSTTLATTTCGILAKCGNGKVEIGETCDEGGLNGQYNHCNLKCSGLTASCGDGVVTSTFEVCDTKIKVIGGVSDTLVCVGGVNDGKDCTVNSAVVCNNACISLSSGAISSATFTKLLPLTFTCASSIAVSSANGVCKAAYSAGAKYSSTQKQSCAFDCQAYGPYCGDGLVQAEFGEECDGNQACSIGSGSNSVDGQRICKQCRWKNQSAIVYYNFDDVWVTSPTSFIPNVATANNLMAYCTGQANAGCPAVALLVNDDKKQAMYFNGTSNYFTIDHQPNFDVKELTIATWIKVATTSEAGRWYTILGKQDVSSPLQPKRDYNFVFHTTSTGAVDVLGLSSRNWVKTSADQVIILGESYYGNKPSIFNGNEWHFVAVTMNLDRMAKYYVDGNLVGSFQTDGKSETVASGNYKIWIGLGDDPSVGGKYFNGYLDELQMYGKALSEGEIDDLYKNSKNFCEAKIVPAIIAAPTSCGNGIIDDKEVCDNGSKNGIACTSGYNKSCSYCSSDCKNVITVSANGYCGDGIISGSEKCDVDGSLLYSSATGTYNVFPSTFATLFSFKIPPHNGYLVPSCGGEYNLHLNANSNQNFINLVGSNLIGQIGTKSCVNNCSSISNNCIECGLQVGGTKVSGAMINVLDPTSKNPLLASTTSAGPHGVVTLLYLGKGQNADEVKDLVTFHESANADQSFYKFLFQNINSNGVCSDATQPRSYKIALNADFSSKHLIDFPISSNAAPDKYNLILSPVINISPATTTGRHIRMVMSWVGDASYNMGFIVPSSTNPTASVTYQDTSLNIVGITTGTNYYATNNKAGIWYHGFNKVETSNVKTVTVKTSDISGGYAFYVYTPADAPFSKSNYTNSLAQLKVEIYEPETDNSSSAYRYFARPVKTYLLEQAISSDNAASQYWHVFNIKYSNKGLTQLFDTDVSSYLNNVEDISRIITSPVDIKMKY